MSNKANEKSADVKNKNKRDARNEQIAALEKEIAETKYNKRTQFAIGLLKAKLAKLKERAQNQGKGQKKGDGFSVRKSGDATVVLLGFPSVGKSTLLNTLTNAESPVGSYAFTTLTCIPGTLEYRGAKIQVLDVPGIVEGAARGTGRGKEVLQVIRTADLIIVVLDVFYPEHYQIINNEVREVGVRLNQHQPDIKITKTTKGGIDVGSTVKLHHLDNATIVKMMQEMGYVNASIVIRDDIDADQFIDAVEANKVYIPAVTLLNKIDMVNEEHIKKIEKAVPIDVKISAQKNQHIEMLKELIFERLSFIRLYLKEIGKPADMKEPLIMKSPCTLQNLCEKLHRDFVTKFKFARIKGPSVKFDGQKITNIRHELCDEDIVELHIR
ncbi:MAG: OBG GTPase family GTP-binding protein [Candidatus Woesearchaeota archaeon]